MDLYRSLLSKALFPAFEAARGRPTVPLLRYLGETETWSAAQLRDLQAGLMRRLLRHAYQHTNYYRTLFDEHGLRVHDIATVEDLVRLPLLDRPITRASLESRIASAPPHVAITKTTSGSSGEPITVKYNVESRYWRDATRWRGYGWGGYEIGMRALHYWGFGAPSLTSWFQKRKVDLDRALKRDLYLDCTPRDEASLRHAVSEIIRFKPHVMVAYAGGAAALAKFVLTNKLRAWNAFPVLTGAEALLKDDRRTIEEAFGPAYDTYGCREVMLIGSECEQHDGLHTSMENMIVEVVVREGGTTRPAKPGEVGEVVVTDLHNLACPMIRYVNGDLAMARDPDDRCACGRGLSRIGPIEGRVTDTLYDGAGNAVGGLVFNILFASIGAHARSFQVHQKIDRSIVLKVVPFVGTTFPEKEAAVLRQHAAKYLPGAPFSIEVVDDIPLSAAGKRRVVVVDKA